MDGCADGSHPRRGAAQGLQAVQGRRQDAREALLPIRDAARLGHVGRRRRGDHRARGDLEVDDPGDPGTISFVPRPDWYFYFLFQLLRIFKWPESVILGTIGIPTIALLLLVALPFVDTRAERHPLRRPVALVGAILAVVSMGVLTYKGAVAKETLGSEEINNVPTWAAKEGFANNKLAVKGAQLFALSGCLNCHTYNGAGGHNLGAPDLTAEGAKGRGIKFQIAHLQCPSCVHKGSPMPSFKSLGLANLTALATFLEASKGAK